MNMSANKNDSFVTLEGTPPAFGHDMLKMFGFEEGYINLNHGNHSSCFQPTGEHNTYRAIAISTLGSYGSLPLPVAEACEKWSRKIESNPDKFMRLDMASELGAVRRRLASMVGAGPDEIVIVPSALHGVNTVLRNFGWNEGDVIVGSQ